MYAVLIAESSVMMGVRAYFAACRSQELSTNGWVIVECSCGVAGRVWAVLSTHWSLRRSWVRSLRDRKCVIETGGSPLTTEPATFTTALALTTFATVWRMERTIMQRSMSAPVVINLLNLTLSPQSHGLVGEAV